MRIARFHRGRMKGWRSWWVEGSVWNWLVAKVLRVYGSVQGVLFYVLVVLWLWGLMALCCCIGNQVMQKKGIRVKVSVTVSCMCLGRTIRGRRIRHRWRIMGSRVRLVLPIAIPNLCSPPPTIIKSMKEIAKLRFQCIKTEVYLMKVLNTKSLSKKHCFNIFHALWAPTSCMPN